MSKTENDSTPEAKGVGRPGIKFTEEQKELIRRLSELFCSQQDIAYALGVNRSTIERHAKELMAEGKGRGRVKLRRAQMDKALEGNPTMLIWLGKQMLGQSDSPGDEGDNLVLPWEGK